MIYSLSGTLIHLTGEFAVIECSGVGYKLGVSASTASRLAPSVNKKATVYTHMAVREDSVELYGFVSEEELELFKRLISVSGVGPKGAMSILGTLGADGLRTSVIHGDAKSISSAQGIGPKTAQRIIIELKDRLAQGGAVEFETGVVSGGEKQSQVIDTLSLYGFSRTQVVSALKKQDMSLPIEELIADTLRELGKEGRL